MTINKEAIQKTIDLMVADQNIRLNMGDWIRPNVRKSEENWCGTTACIAGYVIIAEKGGVGKFSPYELGSYSSFAANALGISEDEAARLFYPPTQEAWEINKDQAIRMLEHLRDYGKVDWSVIGFYNIKFEESEDWN